MNNILTMTNNQNQHTELRPRILIADDESDAAELLARILEQDYVVMVAGGGVEAAHLLNSHAFDLVLLDVMMQDMNGLAVLQMIRSLPRYTDVPVMLVSSLSSSDEIVQGLRRGANDYVTKPYDMDVVQARIKTQLSLKRRHDVQRHDLIDLKTNAEMKSRFLRMASHDLKNPLNNIRLAHYYLQTVFGVEADAQDALNTIETAVLSINHLIEEFVETAALEEGRTTVQLERVTVEDVIWEVIARHGAEANRKNITLLMGDTDGVVVADRTRLFQIISNLVGNAVKFSPVGAMVTVSSSLVDDRVHITVADEGPGIPLAERSSLFSPYTKLSVRPTGGESGSGLGLWIVRELARLQHGIVGVECPLDGGSLFWVDLPMFSDIG
jgi:two-component system sensor histidine kinase/response regulator